MGISQFSFPNTIYYGAGAIDNLPEYIRDTGFSNPLVVTDPGMLKTDVFPKVEGVLKAAGMDYAVFSGVNPNPLDSDIDKAVAVFKEAACDGLIGLGEATLEGGDVVRPKFTVKFTIAGMGIAPAGAQIDYTGHHHLLIDRPPLGEGPDGAEELANGLPADDNHKHFGGGQTEDEDVVIANLFPNLHVGSVHRADRQCAVEREFHVARTGRLQPCRGNLL